MDNLPIYFGTGIEKSDLLFVLPLNASFASSVDRRWILRRMQRVLTIRQGALERRALKDVYLYNELAALAVGVRAARADRHPSSSRARPRDLEPPSRGASRSLVERASGESIGRSRSSPSAPTSPWESTRSSSGRRRSGACVPPHAEYTRYELERFDFDAGPNWIRVALVGPSGEVRYLEDF